jgi:DNA adenine methylase
MVVLSGYPSERYERALAGWARDETEAQADRGGKRVEVLWINPLAMKARRPLFAAE